MANMGGGGGGGKGGEASVFNEACSLVKPGDKNLGLASFFNLNTLHPKHSPKGYMCGVCANT